MPPFDINSTNKEKTNNISERRWEYGTHDAALSYDFWLHHLRGHMTEAMNERSNAEVESSERDLTARHVIPQQTVTLLLLLLH